MTDIFAELGSRLNPEVLRALKVILSAIFEEPMSSCQEAEELRFRREDHARRERIARAERGVETRRKNAKNKKQVGGLKKKRPVQHRTKKDKRR
jgi:hypothetical protein